MNEFRSFILANYVQRKFQWNRKYEQNPLLREFGGGALWFQDLAGHDLSIQLHSITNTNVSILEKFSCFQIYDNVVKCLYKTEREYRVTDIT